MSLPAGLRNGHDGAVVRAEGDEDERIAVAQLRCDLLAALRVPDTDAAVEAPQSEEPAVAAEVRSENPAAMAQIRRQECAVPSTPQRPARRAMQSEPLSVGAELHVSQPDE
jgi:hypothetical protein